MAAPKEKKYTYEDLEKLDLPERRELIYGNIYIGESEEKFVPGVSPIVDMSPAPRPIHQEISARMCTLIQNHIDKHKGKCKTYHAPFDVYLYDGMTVQPDVFVTCDPSRIDDKGLIGAPDWVIEILSPSTAKRDLFEKLAAYRENGVREYWIIDPDDKRIIVYPFEENKNIETYTFDSEIPVHIFANNPEPLKVKLSDYIE